ncbi:LLM class flavin-dependent oxidoreductase, partial [Pseudomonas syringae pv. tagetis]
MKAYEQPDTNRHPAFAKVFTPGHHTFGLIAPLEVNPDAAAPTKKDHEAL